MQRFREQILTIAPSHTQHSGGPIPTAPAKGRSLHWAEGVAGGGLLLAGAGLQDAELMQLIFNAEKPWGNSMGLEGGQREPNGERG